MTAAAKLLGVDFGRKRVGLAVSDPDRKFAFPLSIYERQTPERDAAHFRSLVASEGIAGIVLGLPVHLDGREGQSAGEARVFGTWLAEVTEMPVVFWDERFTTAQAESALWEAGLSHQKRKDRRDKVAAQILLQSYLDAGCPPESPPGPLDE